MACCRSRLLDSLKSCSFNTTDEASVWPLFMTESGCFSQKGSNARDGSAARASTGGLSVSSALLPEVQVVIAAALVMWSMF